MDFIQFLHGLSRDANPAAEGFQPRALYVVFSVVMPVAIGMVVGFGLKLIERVLGVELGKGGH